MRFLADAAIIGCAILVISLAPAGLAQKPPAYILEPFHGLDEPFYEGCCILRNVPRPKNVSQSTVPAARLRKALHCATNNGRVGRTRDLAKDLGDPGSLHVAYFYGNYMHGTGDRTLTIGVYSVDGKHGVLFDVDWDSSEYSVSNLPPLLWARKQWRVGEIFGGLGSYTRLWYLAQEIGSRPRVTIPVATIARTKPKSCFVITTDETGWKADD